MFGPIVVLGALLASAQPTVSVGDAPPRPAAREYTEDDCVVADTLPEPPDDVCERRTQQAKADLETASREELAAPVRTYLELTQACRGGDDGPCRRNTPDWPRIKASLDLLSARHPEAFDGLLQRLAEQGGDFQLHGGCGVALLVLERVGRLHGEGKTQGELVEICLDHYGSGAMTPGSVVYSAVRAELVRSIRQAGYGKEVIMLLGGASKKARHIGIWMAAVRPTSQVYERVFGLLDDEIPEVRGVARALVVPGPCDETDPGAYAQAAQAFLQLNPDSRVAARVRRGAEVRGCRVRGDGQEVRIRCR